MLLDNELRSKNLLNQRKQNAGFSKKNVLNFPQNYAGYVAKNNASFGNSATDAAKSVIKTGGDLAFRKNYFNEFKNSVFVQKFDSIFGAVTAGMAVVGFAIGGPGLIYDSMVKKARAKNNGTKQNVNPQNQTAKIENKVESGNVNQGAIVKTSNANDLYNKNAFDLSARLEQMKKNSAASNLNVSDSTSALLNQTKKKVSTTGNDKTKENKKDKKTEYGYIEPETKFGKIGLACAKVGLIVSGTAGMLTAISLRVPLMAAGEFVGNVVSAPIINTPIGYGLMSIGMSTLLSGRAFENDPLKKINDTRFANKSALGKVGYIMTNMGEAIKETCVSMGEVCKKTAQLLSTKQESRKEARHFFKHYFFNIKSSTITLKQNIHANGKCAVETVVKSHPYRLHAFAGILAASGLLLIGEGILEKVGILKNKKAEDARKACFNAAKAGQYADNIGLSLYGMERISKGAPIFGIPVLASGLTALTGAHKVDEDSGKGIIWAALAFFFTLLTLERGVESIEARRIRSKLLKELKKNGKAFEAQSKNFARMFDIDFSRIKKDGKEVLDKKDLKNILWACNDQEKKPLEFTKFFHGEDSPKAKQAKEGMDRKVEEAKKALVNSNKPVLREIPKFLDAMKEILGGHYNPDINEQWIVGQLKAKGLSDEFIGYVKQKGVIKIPSTARPGKELPEILEGVHRQNAEKFGKNYDDELSRVIADKETPSWAVDSAKAAKTKFAEKLKKE